MLDWIYFAFNVVTWYRSRYYIHSSSVSFFLDLLSEDWVLDRLFQICDFLIWIGSFRVILCLNLEVLGAWSKSFLDLRLLSKIEFICYRFESFFAICLTQHFCFFCVGLNKTCGGSEHFFCCCFVLFCFLLIWFHKIRKYFLILCVFSCSLWTDLNRCPLTWLRFSLSWIKES